MFKLMRNQRSQKSPVQKEAASSRRQADAELVEVQESAQGAETQRFPK
jgi:hypothetical protein